MGVVVAVLNSSKAFYLYTFAVGVNDITLPDYNISTNIFMIV